MEGIFTPSEIAVLEELDGNEKMVLSIYKYYTEKGKYHCCTFTNEEIGKRIGRSKRQIIRIKNHLKELGFIRIIGIKVYYEGCHSCHSKGDTVVTEGCHSCHSMGDTVVTHNNNKKNKKEKKEEKEENEENEPKTNWELLLDSLSDEYKTTDALDEYKKLIKEQYNIEYDASVDKFNSIKNIESNTIETYKKQIESILNVYVTEKRLKEQQKIGITKDKEERHTGTMLI